MIPEEPVDPRTLRGKDRFRILMRVGVILAVTGPLVGFLMTTLAQTSAMRLIEEMKSPTPKDLADATMRSVWWTIGGLGVGLLGAGMIIVAAIGRYVATRPGLPPPPS